MLIEIIITFWTQHKRFNREPFFLVEYSHNIMAVAFTLIKNQHENLQKSARKLNLNVIDGPDQTRQTALALAHY